MTRILQKNVTHRPFVSQSLIERLRLSPGEFSFAKAVDVVLGCQGVCLANFVRQDLAKIIIKSTINFQSKFCEIHSVTEGFEKRQEIHTNIEGIAGIDGCLPDCYLDDYVMRGAKRSRVALADFFDIFNNRVLSMRYVFLKKHNVSCLSVFVEESLVGKIALSLSGFLWEKREENSLIPAQLKISAQNLFWSNARSSEGLRCMLASFLEVPIKIRQFVGGFVEADVELQTRIGCSENKFNNLGKTAYLGRKSWNAMKGIDVLIGPLSYEKYLNFLPKLSRYDEKNSVIQKVRELIRIYVPVEIEVKVHVFLEQGNVKATLLNGVKRLHRDTFIKGTNGENVASFVEKI